VALGAVALVWAAWTGISSTRLFAIENVEVTGVQRLTAADVIAQAAVPDGASLLNIDADALEGRLLANPWIEEVRLSRRIPSTLRVEVQERVPVAVVDSGLTLWFVDATARVVAESTPESATPLPVIRDVPDFVAEPGEASDSEVLRNALRVLSGMNPDLIATVTAVSAPALVETALLTSGNVEIMIGEAVRLEEKSLLVADILREQGAQVVFIDVRSVERPISRGLNP
jgi:hypothetical protein